MPVLITDRASAEQAGCIHVQLNYRSRGSDEICEHQQRPEGAAADVDHPVASSNADAPEPVADMGIAESSLNDQPLDFGGIHVSSEVRLVPPNVRRWVLYTSL
jgi:hypothetical protein